VVLIVALGVYPKPVLERIQPSVDHLIAHVQHVDPSLHLPKKGVGPPVAVGPNDNVDGTATVATAVRLPPPGVASAPRGVSP
jgi:hypothetical protein